MKNSIKMVMILVFSAAWLMACPEDDEKKDTQDDTAGDVAETSGDTENDTIAPDTVEETSPETAEETSPETAEETDVEQSDCEVVCNAMAAADCPNSEDDPAECVMFCDMMLDSPCSTVGEAAMDCWGPTPTFDCDENGETFHETCDSEMDEVGTCMDDYFVCNYHCELVVAANCEDGPPSLDDCVGGCMEFAMGNCSEAWDTVIDCVTEVGDPPTYTCDENGAPIVADCATEFEQMYMCIEF